MKFLSTKIIWIFNKCSLNTIDRFNLLKDWICTLYKLCCERIQATNGNGKCYEQRFLKRFLARNKNKLEVKDSYDCDVW